MVRFDQENKPDEFAAGVASAEFVFHPPGVNQPQREEEFHTGNAELTRQVAERLAKAGSRAPVDLSSSIQAEQDNPYGLSKREAEATLACYAGKAGRAVIYRLTNVFGKWCQPHDNSVVATFCHNTAHGLPVGISDPSREIELVTLFWASENFDLARPNTKFLKVLDE